MHDDAPHYARFEVGGRVVHRTTETDQLVIRTIATTIARLYQGGDVDIVYEDTVDFDEGIGSGDEGRATGAATQAAPPRDAIAATR